MDDDDDDSYGLQSKKLHFTSTQKQPGGGVWIGLLSLLLPLLLRACTGTSKKLQSMIIKRWLYSIMVVDKKEYVIFGSLYYFEKYFQADIYSAMLHFKNWL